MIVASWRTIATAMVGLFVAVFATADVAKVGDVVVGPGATAILEIPEAFGLLDSSLAQKGHFGLAGSNSDVTANATRVYGVDGIGYGLDLQPTFTCSVPFAVSIATDSSGTLYALGFDYVLYGCAPDGTPLPPRSLPNGPPLVPALADLDLAPDGCTLRYVAHHTTSIRGYDVCSNVVLPTIDLAEKANFIRGLKGGGYVVGGGPELFVYSQNNTLIRTIDLGGGVTAVIDIAFSSDGQSMYLVTSGTANPIEKRRVSDAGIVAASANPFESHGVYSLAVFGEQRPTAVPLASASIPAISPRLLAMLAAALALIGFVRSR